MKAATLSALLCLPLAMTAFADEAKKPLIERREAGDPTTDKEFLIKAIACEVANVKFAEKAAKNASHEDVRKLAQTIVDDHKKVRDELMEQAKKMRLAVVEGLDKQHRETYDKLAKLDGKEFDKEYMTCLVDGHEKAVKMYKKWAKDAKEAGVREAEAANLFDLRRIIGGLFIVYGVLLTVLGLFDSQEEIDKAAGVNINLWAGLGMLIFGLLMITWALTRPLGTEIAEGEEYPERAAPRGVDAAALSEEARRGTARDRERPGGADDARPE